MLTTAINPASTVIDERIIKQLSLPISIVSGTIWPVSSSLTNTLKQVTFPSKDDHLSYSELQQRNTLILGSVGVMSGIKGGVRMERSSPKVDSSFIAEAVSINNKTEFIAEHNPVNFRPYEIRLGVAPDLLQESVSVLPTGRKLQFD